MHRGIPAPGDRWESSRADNTHSQSRSSERLIRLSSRLGILTLGALGLVMTSSGSALAINQSKVLTTQEAMVTTGIIAVCDTVCHVLGDQAIKQSAIPMAQPGHEQVAKTAVPSLTPQPAPTAKLPRQPIVNHNVIAQTSLPSGAVGFDVSYPNGNATVPASAFNTIGVNGGRNFTSNPYLLDEVNHVNGKPLMLYANTDYPGVKAALPYQNGPKRCTASDENCLAYNYGYNAGVYAVNYALSQHVISAEWWMDTETMNAWSSDQPLANRSSLQGEVDAIQAVVKQATGKPATIGFYSTLHQWSMITSPDGTPQRSWHNGFRSWVATGETTATEAKPYCSPDQDFTAAGSVYMVQFVGKYAMSSGVCELDTDIKC